MEDTKTTIVMSNIGPNLLTSNLGELLKGYIRTICCS
jgi:hypothetical protein